MRWLRSIAAGVLALFFVGSCSREKPAPKIENLRFPVVILFGNASIRLCQGPSELTRMHSNYLTLNNQDPVLIDSEFKIYSLDNLRSVHGGLWLMANPSGATDVTFELKAKGSGRERARELFGLQLKKQTWRDDIDASLKTLSGSGILLEMVKVLQPERG